MTSRIFYYFSIAAFVFGIFTFPFTNNVFESFAPSVLLGAIGAIVSLTEPDVDRTRRDAVIALGISFVAAIILSILAPQFGIIWWGPVCIMMEVIAIVSLIRRYIRKQSESDLADDSQNGFAEPIEQTSPETGGALPGHSESPTLVAVESKEDSVEAPSPIIPIVLHISGIIWVLACSYLGAHLFVVNEWWIEIFPAEHQGGNIGSMDPEVCISEIFSCLGAIIGGIANAIITALAGGLVGAIIGLATYGGVTAVYLARRSNGNRSSNA